MSRIKANKEYILATVEQLEKGIQLSPEQMEFWALILRRIVEGESAEVVLNLKRKVGERQIDEDKRKRIGFVLHLVASHYKPLIDPRQRIEERPPKLTLEESILKVLPEVQKIMGDGHKYEFEQVRDWWYDKDKKHMQSPVRSRFDADNPYP
jgi:hypothetical protein